MATKISKPKKKDGELHRMIHDLLKENGGMIMLYWDKKSNELMLLIKHYKYSNPVKEAERLYLGKYKGKINFTPRPDGTYYITNTK